MPPELPVAFCYNGLTEILCNMTRKTDGVKIKKVKKIKKSEDTDLVILKVL